MVCGPSTAAIIAIGDELVAAETTDRNSDWLVDALAGHAVACRQRRMVPDDRSAIAGAIRDLAAIADIVITTGGLGPTPDDLTRFGLGDVVSPGVDLTPKGRVSGNHTTKKSGVQGMGRPLATVASSHSRRINTNQAIPQTEL